MFKKLRKLIMNLFYKEKRTVCGDDPKRVNFTRVQGLGRVKEFSKVDGRTAVEYYKEGEEPTSDLDITVTKDPLSFVASNRMVGESERRDTRFFDPSGLDSLSQIIDDAKKELASEEPSRIMVHGIELKLPISSAHSTRRNIMMGHAKLSEKLAEVEFPENTDFGTEAKRPSALMEIYPLQTGGVSKEVVEEMMDAIRGSSENNDHVMTQEEASMYRHLCTLKHHPAFQTEDARKELFKTIDLVMSGNMPCTSGGFRRGELNILMAPTSPEVGKYFDKPPMMRKQFAWQRSGPMGRPVISPIDPTGEDRIVLRMPVPNDLPKDTYLNGDSITGKLIGKASVGDPELIVRAKDLPYMIEAGFIAPSTVDKLDLTGVPETLLSQIQAMCHMKRRSESKSASASMRQPGEYKLSDLEWRERKRQLSEKNIADLVGAEGIPVNWDKCGKILSETDYHLGEMITIKPRLEDLSKNEKRKMSPRRIKKESKKVIKVTRGKHR